jgi:hypothetical protein
MGQKSNGYRILVGKPEGKSPLGRPRLVWMENITTDLRETGAEGSCEHGNEPLGNIYMNLLTQ